MAVVCLYIFHLHVYVYLFHFIFTDVQRLLANENVLNLETPVQNINAVIMQSLYVSLIPHAFIYYIRSMLIS